MKNILITGGTGLIGKQLSDLLVKKGFNVRILSRSKKIASSNMFFWDYRNNEIDVNVFCDLDYVIHLAGANIGTIRWTAKRKREIITSRVESANFLFKEIKKREIPIKAFISASAVGYYGTLTSDQIFTELSEPANDFLGTTCSLWESSVNQFKDFGIRTVILRTGVVFSKDGGALGKLMKPIKFGFGSVLGLGNQYIPWIHLDDLCEMYILSIENAEMDGVYNAVSPEHITNSELTYKIAQLLKKKIWLPKIPSFIIRSLMGEMADIILKGSRVSSEKIAKQGFEFRYPTVVDALKSLQ